MPASSSPAAPSSHGASGSRGPASSSAAARGPSSSHGSSHGSSSGGAFDEAVCAFWLGTRCYGIATSLVGEVVPVEDIIAVPLAPPAVLGLFNLRGTPVALVDTARVLELPAGTAVVGHGPGQRVGQPGRPAIALVLRRGASAIAGLLIDRMDSVVGVGQGTFTPRDWAAEHAAVAGFVELAARELVVTLFDSAVVVERLRALEYR